MQDTIGVDISKDTVDAHRLSDGTHRQFDNDKAGLRRGSRRFADGWAERRFGWSVRQPAASIETWKPCWVRPGTAWSR